MVLTRGTGLIVKEIETIPPLRYWWNFSQNPSFCMAIQQHAQELVPAHLCVGPLCDEGR